MYQASYIHKLKKFNVIGQSDTPINGIWFFNHISVIYASPRSHLSGVNHLLDPMSCFSQVKVGFFWFVGEVGEVFVPRCGWFRGLDLRAFVPLVKGGDRNGLGVGAEGGPPGQPIVTAASPIPCTLPVPRSNSSVLTGTRRIIMNLLCHVTDISHTPQGLGLSYILPYLRILDPRMVRRARSSFWRSWPSFSSSSKMIHG